MKYREKHEIRQDSKELHRLVRLSLMDPMKMITSETAMQDPYFYEEPPPVFAGETNIPYPEREFMTDDVSEDKTNDNKQHQQRQQQQVQPETTTNASASTAARERWPPHLIN